MLVKLLRFIRGYVEFEVLVADYGEFLKTASYIGKFYNVKQCKGKILATTSIATFKKITPLLRKFGAKRRIVHKTGVPFIINRNKKRLGVYIGFVLMLLFLFVITRFVWTVDVLGSNDKINSEIINSLSNYGVKPGAVISSIDNRIIGNKILSSYPEISFISINVVGCRAIVEIKLIDELPDVDKPETYGNIIASKNGKIKYMEVYDGFSLVEVGDNVFEGELLVSGTKEDYFGRLIAVNSDAEIYAETETLYIFKLPIREEVPKRTGEVKIKRYLTIFGINIPLHLHFFDKGNYDYEVENKELNAFGVTLPIRYTEIRMNELILESVQYTDEELNEKCKEMYESELTEIEDKIEILNEEINTYNEEGYFCYEVELKTNENIAKYVAFELEIQKNSTQIE